MTTQTDNLNRTETPAASPWTACYGSGINLNGSAAVSTAGADKGSYYSDTWGNDQESYGTVGNLSSNTNYAGVLVRADSSGNAFQIVTDGASGAGHTDFILWSSGSPSVIGSATTTFANGDKIRLTVSGSSGSITLTAYKDTGGGWTQVGQLTGQTGPNSGAPGIGIYGTATIDDWGGTDGAAGNITRDPALGQLTLTGHVPQVRRSSDTYVDAGAGALTLSSYTPRLSNSGQPSAIQYIGAATGTTSATIPTHQAGDMIVAFAYRDGSTTAPTVPAGVNWTTLFNSVGANTNSHAVAYKIAASSGETTGTFTNATSLVVGVYRGVRAIGGSASGSGASTTPSFSTVTMTDSATGRSFVIGFVGHRSTNVTIESPPAGMWNRTSVADATDEAALHDTAFGVKAWPTTTSSVGGTSSGWRTHTVELLSREAFAPDGAELNIVGHAPTVSQAGAGLSATPGVGTLTLTGYAPTVIAPLSVTPSVGTLTASGYVPTVSVSGGSNTTITPSVGQIVVTGYEPTQDYETDAPITGTLTLTGYAPTVRATQSVATNVGTLALTGYAPTLGFSYTIQPTTGTLAATGYAPSLAYSYTVQPSNAALSVTGYVPSVQVTQPGQVTPDAGTLILTGYQPGVGISYTVAPVVGALSVTGLAPTVQVTLSAAPSVADLTLTGHAPTVQATANVWITPDVGVVTLGGYAPVLSQAGSFAANPDVGQIILAGFAPNVINSGDAIDERAAGGHPLYRRWATWQTRLPTDEEIRKQREALGILPKRAQKIVRAEVKRITDGVDSPEQAALLASAYTQESQRDRLKARLKAESDAANLRWRDEMAAIASALILGELKRRADEELLAQLMAAEEQERRDIGDLLQIWMQM